MALHPVDVALDGVDLSVVGEHPEGMREVPGRKRIGGIALVEYRHRRHEARIEQVGIEDRQLFGQEHALVDQRARRERTHVEIRNGCAAHLRFNAAADDEEIALDLLHVLLSAGVEHDLFDFRPRRIGLFADDRNVHRHLTPAIDVVTEAEDLGLDDRAACFLRGIIRTRQEDHADADTPRLQRMARQADFIREKLLRYLDVQASAIARLAIGVDGAAVPNALERIDRMKDDFAARLAVDRRHQTNAARIALLVWRIAVVLFQVAGVLAVPRDFIMDGLGHGVTPLRSARPARLLREKCALRQQRHDHP